MNKRIEWLNFFRNIKGRYDLLRFLFKWDRDYRKDMIVTMLAFGLLVYSLATYDSIYDAVAIIVEITILMVQLGGEMSIMPADYRPRHGGVRYTAQTSSHIAYGELSFLMSGVLAATAEENLGMATPRVPLKLSPETALTSDTINDAVMLRPSLPYAVMDGETNYIRSRHQLRYIAIRVADKKTHTTNGEKLALHGLADSLYGDGVAQVRRSWYYDALLTAEAFRSRIYRTNIKGEREVYTDLTTYFPVAEERQPWQYGLRFKPEFYKDVSGHIGITTLLVTENRRVAMLQQGSNNAIGARTVTLGGSGSLDYADMARVGNHPDLRRVIVQGMARELAEETGMKKHFDDIRGNTMVTGFFRWVDRCGKPEFTGITRAGRLAFTADIRIDGDEVTHYDEIPVTLERLEDFHKVVAWLEGQNARLSLSSLMCLYRMTVIADYNRDDATEDQKRIYRDMSAFLFG
jgi:hypothetical protein